MVIKSEEENSMINKVWAMYFSGTGTTQKIVKKIAETAAEKLRLPVQEYDFTLPGIRKQQAVFTKTDLVIFGTPVYAGRVPNVLIKYLHTIQGGGALAVPVVLFGNRNYDDALIELRNILEEDEFHTIAGAAFVGEHSFSYNLAKGRPDTEDMKIAEGFATKIAGNVGSGNLPEGPAYVKGCDPIRPYYTPRDRKGTPINILKVKPKTNDNCDSCGICSKVCPMGSIQPDNVKEVTGICIKCGACVKKCPKHAKYYDDEGYLYHKTELELGYARRAEPEVFCK